MATHACSRPLPHLLALALFLTPGCLPAGLASGSAFLDAVTCVLWSGILGGLTAVVLYVVSKTREARRQHRAYRARACASAEVLTTGAGRCGFACTAATEHWVWLRVTQPGSSRALALPLVLRIATPTRVLFEHAGTLQLDDDASPEGWPVEPGTVGMFGEDFRLARFSPKLGEEVVVELRYQPTTSPPDPAASLAALELWVAPTPPPPLW